MAAENYTKQAKYRQKNAQFLTAKAKIQGDGI